MKRILTILALLAGMCFQLGAQEDMVASLMERLQHERLTFTYSCTIDAGGLPVNSSGTVTAQGNCYKVSAQGVDIYCDGSTRWLVDTAAKEVYIEAAEGLGEFLAAPQDYLGALSDLKYSTPKSVPATEELGDFRFDCSKLDDNWVVTDLR